MEWGTDHEHRECKNVKNGNKTDKIMGSKVSDGAVVYIYRFCLHFSWFIPFPALVTCSPFLVLVYNTSKATSYFALYYTKSPA